MEQIYPLNSKKTLKPNAQNKLMGDPRKKKYLFQKNSELDKNRLKNSEIKFKKYKYV